MKLVAVLLVAALAGCATAVPVRQQFHCLPPCAA